MHYSQLLTFFSPSRIVNFHIKEWVFYIWNINSVKIPHRPTKPPKIPFIFLHSQFVYNSFKNLLHKQHFFFIFTKYTLTIEVKQLLSR